MKNMDAFVMGVMVTAMVFALGLVIYNATMEESEIDSHEYLNAGVMAREYDSARVAYDKAMEDGQIRKFEYDKIADAWRRGHTTSIFGSLEDQQ